MLSIIYISISIIITSLGCDNKPTKEIPTRTVTPRIITEKVNQDSDDPAIWIHPTNPSKSLIIGTDKGGSLYAFDLKGKIVKEYDNLKRPNNVDIAYGFPFNGELIDIAVVTERLKQRIRVFRLPELEPIDNGDLIVFNGDKERAPMGIATYRREKDNSFFVFVSGKSGPKEGYIAQYRLESYGQNTILLKEVRQFGKYSGLREIEAIAVDEKLGYVYYSDEGAGIRKYHADPDNLQAGKELAFFARKGFTSDHEGISIYHKTDTTGYIIVSDQEANQFWIFPREGTAEDPHKHYPLKIIKAATIFSDGNEVTNIPLPGFPKGLFVAMSEGRIFHYYSWEDIAGNGDI